MANVPTRLKFPSKMVDFFQVAKEKKTETTDLSMTAITESKKIILDSEDNAMLIIAVKGELPAL